MKKTAFVLCLYCVAITGVFGQWAFQFYCDMSASLFGFITPTGMYAEKTMLDDYGEQVPNTGTSHLDRVSIISDTPGKYFPKSNFSLFSPRLTHHTESYNMINDGRFRLLYNHGGVHCWIGFNTGPSFQNFINNRGNVDQKPLMETLLHWITLEEFQVIASNRLLSFHVGNIGGFGPIVPMYSGVSSMSRLLSVPSFGVMVPSGLYIYEYIPATNLLSRVQPLNFTAQPVNFANFSFRFDMLRVLFELPLIVDVSMSIDLHPINAGSNLSQKRLSGGAAVRGLRIADLFNFDLTYKVRGGDGTLDDSWDGQTNTNHNAYQPDGRGAAVHVMNLAVGVPSAIPDLGLSFGYSVLFPVYERDYTNAKPDDDLPYAITKKGPVYNGIDLRLEYTGIPDIRLTMANNVTFANAAEPVLSFDYGAPVITGHSTDLRGFNQLPYRSQQWFALYNSLVANYNLGRNISAALEFVHRMSITTDLNSDENRGFDMGTGWGKSVKFADIVQGTAFIDVTMGGGLLLQTGASVWIENRQTTYSDYLAGASFKRPTKWKGGAVGFAIPIRVMVHF